MHIAPYDNQNKPIVDADDKTVPLNYFNIIKLKKDQAFEYAVPGYETCIVPATGTVDVNIEGFKACLKPFDVHIDSARCRNDAGLVTRNSIFKRLIFFQFDDVEIVQWNRLIICINDGFILIVVRSDMHNSEPLAFGWAGVLGQKCFQFMGIRHRRRASRS